MYGLTLLQLILTPAHVAATPPPPPPPPVVTTTTVPATAVAPAPVVPVATTTTTTTTQPVTTVSGLECVVTVSAGGGNTMTYSPAPAVNGVCAAGTPESETVTGGQG